MARIEARKQRVAGARERDADARLQDAVSVGDATDRLVERRPVQRMGDDANQLPRGITRQPRIAVERDAVAHLRQYRAVADAQDEARVGGAAKQTVELFDFAALPLPSHPEAFLLVPLTRAMEQEKPVRTAVAMPGVELPDGVGRGGENLFIER